MTPKMSRLTGDREMRARLLRMAKQRPEKIGRGLFKFGTRVLTDSQDNYVPVRLSVLRGSGRVQLPKTSKGGSSVDITYGGAAGAYAKAVHDHPSESSPPSWKAAEANGRGVHFRPQGRGPKYLLKPVLKHAEDFMAFMANEIRNDAL